MACLVSIRTSSSRSWSSSERSLNMMRTSLSIRSSFPFSDVVKYTSDFSMARSRTSWVLRTDRWSFCSRTPVCWWISFRYLRKRFVNRLKRVRTNRCLSDSRMPRTRPSATSWRNSGSLAQTVITSESVRMIPKGMVVNGVSSFSKVGIGTRTMRIVSPSSLSWRDRSFGSRTS